MTMYGRSHHFRPRGPQVPGHLRHVFDILVLVQLAPCRWERDETNTPSNDTCPMEAVLTGLSRYESSEILLLFCLPCGDAMPTLSTSHPVVSILVWYIFAGTFFSSVAASTRVESRRELRVLAAKFLMSVREFLMCICQILDARPPNSLPPNS